MVKILLIDDALFCRELVGKVLRQEGYDVVTAVNGRDGLAILQQTAVQLIVLDYQMPLMNGPSFLKVLREKPAWANLPVIMLTDSAQRENVLEAKHFGASEYILKSEFSMPKLIKRIRKRISSASLLSVTESNANVDSNATTNATSGIASYAQSQPKARLATSRRDQVMEAIDKIDGARTLGGVIARVLSIANSPRTGLRDLVKVVQQDPVLSARTLRLANSAAFTSQRQVATTLQEAVRRIGIGGVRSLAMSLGVFEAVSSDSALNLSVIRCWAHALAVAGLMDRMSPVKDVGRSGGGDEPGVGYLSGLCHDLGEILLRQRFAETFAQVEQEAISSGVAVYQILPDAFGLAYDEITQRLMSKLGMPAVICDSILDHARCESGQGLSKSGPGPNLLSLADRYANGMLLGTSVAAMISPVLKSEYSDAPLIDNDALKQEVLTAICAMAQLSPTEEAKLFQQLLPARSQRILYVRNPCFSTFDPIENALKAICKADTLSLASGLEEQRLGGAIVVVATPQVDAPPYSNFLDNDSDLQNPNQRPSLFIISKTTTAKSTTDCDSVLIQYPFNLYALNQFFEQIQPKQSAA